MKFRATILLAVAFIGTGSLWAQDTPALPPTGEADEAPAIPTEVSEPPYAVGDLVVEQGYYLDRGEEEMRINLRFFENKFRLYWIDENGLIAEPEALEAFVRVIGSVRGRSYHKLSLLPEGAGLGAPGIMVPPHTYSLILHIPETSDRAETTQNFRYSPSMDKAVDPTTK